ncbi:MAG: diguanylate cyclase, partial [Rhodoferax sp.]
ESAIRARTVAEKIRNALAEPYRLNIEQDDASLLRVEHCCTASIGVTLFQGHTAHIADVIKWADAAMYDAKDAGRNTVKFYKSPEPASSAP